MRISSRSFKNGEKIPSKYTCDGNDVNPPLEFAEVPEQAKCLVLIMDDPDVPQYLRKDRMWVHWVVYNIPPQTKEIRENSIPPGIVGKGTSGDCDYMGPCPPDREHRYFFKLYALDQLLELPKGATKQEVEEAMQNHLLGSAQLMGTYVRTTEDD